MMDECEILSKVSHRAGKTYLMHYYLKHELESTFLFVKVDKLF